MLRTKSQLQLTEAKNKNLEEFSRIYNHENYPVLGLKPYEAIKGSITVRSLKNDENNSVSTLHNAGNHIISYNRMPKKEKLNSKYNKINKVNRFVEPLNKKTTHTKKGLKNNNVHYDEKSDSRSPSNNNTFMYDILPFYSCERDDHSKLHKENFNIHSLDSAHLEGFCEIKQKLGSEYTLPNRDDQINMLNFSEEIIEGHFRLLGNWIDLENVILLNISL